MMKPGEIVLWSYMPDEGTLPDLEEANRYTRWLLWIFLRLSWIFLPIWVYLLYTHYRRSPEAFFESLPKMIGLTGLCLMGALLIVFFFRKLPDLGRQKAFNYMILTDQRVILFDWMVEDVALLPRSDLVSAEKDYVGGSPAITFRQRNDPYSYAFMSGQPLDPIFAVIKRDQTRKPLAPNP